ncbi:hypothetical protein HMPREF3213_00943 [Heyndrickxia coagulans]|uniref:Uncharacterized protein n=1 Tax=Heyndrickxia coagulans TaxID=1398 RepID=A0A133KX25_HEYCO|nr:hypothetical protein HMPREF3213_00943 [Heyndrickxia coagulans]
MLTYLSLQQSINNNVIIGNRPGLFPDSLVYCFFQIRIEKRQFTTI